MVVRQPARIDRIAGPSRAADAGALPPGGRLLIMRGSATERDKLRPGADGANDGCPAP